MHPSFMVNPQYHLRLESDKAKSPTSSRDKRPKIQLKVQGDRRIPLNVTVVWSQGQRITDLVRNEIVATSGAYTHGFASMMKELSGENVCCVLCGVAFDAEMTQLAIIPSSYLLLSLDIWARFG